VTPGLDGADGLEAVPRELPPAVLAHLRRGWHLLRRAERARLNSNDERKARKVAMQHIEAAVAQTAAAGLSLDLLPAWVTDKHGPV
jgi:hypothetical protein